MTSKTAFTLRLALVLVLVLVLGQQQPSCLVSAASFGNGLERSQMFDLEEEDAFGDGGRPKRDEDWLGGSGGGGGSGLRGSSGLSSGLGGAGTLINEREPRETNVRRPLIFKRETNVRKPLLFKRYASLNDYEAYQGNSKRISGSPLSRHWDGHRRPVRPAGRPTILYI